MSLLNKYSDYIFENFYKLNEKRKKVLLKELK